jgi:hypothetical protein
MRIIFATISVGLSLSSVAYAQQTQMGTASDQDFIKQVMKAAPQQVGEQATIMRMHEGGMQTVKKGTNEFTCMDSPAGGSPMCLDPNAMEWVSALASQTPPPTRPGLPTCWLVIREAATPIPSRRSRSRITTGSGPAHT